MTTGLKPCPFCKSINVAFPCGEEGYICRNCGSVGFGDWNSRPIEDALRSKVEELEKESTQLLRAFNTLYIQAAVADDLNELRRAVDRAHVEAVKIIDSLPQPPHD